MCGFAIHESIYFCSLFWKFSKALRVWRCFFLIWIFRILPDGWMDKLIFRFFWKVTNMCFRLKLLSMLKVLNFDAYIPIFFIFFIVLVICCFYSDDHRWNSRWQRQIEGCCWYSPEMQLDVICTASKCWRFRVAASQLCLSLYIWWK